MTPDEMEEYYVKIIIGAYLVALEQPNAMEEFQNLLDKLEIDLEATK